MIVLGIETSCDETGIALFCTERGLLANQLHSQIALHAPHGGVVPELASRDHVRFCLPLLQAALGEAQLHLRDLDAIAYTAGPGLIGALLVGANFAQGLSLALDIPCLPIHHMEGHLLAALMEEPRPSFPFLSLLVSGGHTLLLAAQGLGQYQILGQSLDDAAGEAFDKTAKILGLPYPGGPALARLALEGTPKRFKFPRPMCDRASLDFSFSGLKTHAAMTYARTEQTAQDKADVAYAFQEAVVDTLFHKCALAHRQTQISRLVVAGGVSANQALRQKFAEFTPNTYQVFYPRLAYCTDNGAMIAFAGAQRLQNQAKHENRIIARARWPLSDLT